MTHSRAPHAGTTNTRHATGVTSQAGPPWDDATRTNFRIRAEERSVPAARRYTRIRLEDIQGIEDDVACESMLLIVSELVTNAVVHTGSTWITCYLWAAADVLHVEVQDQGTRLAGPIIRSATTDDEHGRGLLLVRRLAQDWGIIPDPVEGRSVWAAVPFTPAP